MRPKTTHRPGRAKVSAPALRSAPAQEGAARTCQNHHAHRIVEIAAPVGMPEFLSHATRKRIETLGAIQCDDRNPIFERKSNILILHKVPFLLQTPTLRCWTAFPEE